MIEIVLFVIN